MSPRTKVRADAAKELERASREISQNEILSRLDSSERSALMEHAEEISFSIKHRLFDQGDTIEDVYFPLTGMISLVIVLEDGPTIEAMTVGKEGFVGLPLINEVSTARYRGVCQIEGKFLVLSAKNFVRLIDTLPDLERRLRRYSQFASDVVSQSAACNSVHTVEQRCARWLLISSDAVGSTEFALTQEFLSQMLAVRRPGVNVAMRALTRQLLVSHRYGKVTLMDVVGLKKASCECYATIKTKARELLN